jgi:hypothetical protein
MVKLRFLLLLKHEIIRVFLLQRLDQGQWVTLKLNQQKNQKIVLDLDNDVDRLVNQAASSCGSGDFWFRHKVFSFRFFMF